MTNVFYTCTSPGVGISMVMVTVIVAIYYNVIIAYSLYYMFASFQSPLPWTGCSGWADSNCTEVSAGAVWFAAFPLEKTWTTASTHLCFLSTFLAFCNVSGVILTNLTQENRTCPPSGLVKLQSPSEQYWE